MSDAVNEVSAMALDQKDVERVYALPREDFLPARDALAKQLKAAGDREGSEEAKRLRKPTVAAWAVNQLARARKDELEQLLEAGDELRGLQRKAASGLTREELRTATAARRKAIDALVSAAEGILAEAGHPVSRQTLDHVAQTLEATATDESARDLVQRGVLDKELAAPVGFGELSALSVVAAPPSRERPGRTKKAGREARARGGGEPSKKETEQDARQRERQARQRARAERLAEEAEQAEAEANRLRQEAAEAERAAIKARTAAERAEARAEQARKRAEAAASDVSA